MADISDVMNTLVGLVATALYPNGTSQPSAAGIDCIVYPGWPTASRLDADLLIGKAHITVYPRPEEKDTTRYMTQVMPVAPLDPALTLTVVGQTVTVGGAMPSPFEAHNLAVFVEGLPYLYAVQSNDTLTSIATALATLIAVDHPGTTNSGPVITIAGELVVTHDGVNVTLSGGSAVYMEGPIAPVFCRVGTSGTGIREIRRQERLFQIVIWADTPAHRDAVSAPIDLYLSDRYFITLSDGFWARITYKSSPFTDAMQKEKLYRRDLFYTVEYATTVVDPMYQILAIETNLSADGSTQPPVVTTYQ